MRGLPADDASETHNRIEATGLGRTARRLGKLEGPGNAELLDVACRNPRLGQRGLGGVAQRPGNRHVEPRNNEGKSEPGAGGKRRNRSSGWAHYFPLNSALRFSRKALVP